MAGSYNHCVDEDGKLLDPERLAEMLENGGDVYEAIEEMYGMIWFLAETARQVLPKLSTKEVVEISNKEYKVGIIESPGKN